MKMLHRGEKGFTLIELLVVNAILGVIAAVVALNVAGFFGEGTLQAANTELHQAQTAIVAAMAAVESNDITVTYSADPDTEHTWWAGAPGVIVAHGGGNATADAADYCYGPFRAMYEVSDGGASYNASKGAIVGGEADITGGWGDAIQWNDTYMNWEEAP